MKVLDVHERELRATAAQVGVLIDSLASPNDLLWPRHTWPKMEFDRPLGVGATGGHGPIRYFVEEHNRGKSIKFRFTGPEGFNGFHGYEIVSKPGKAVVLRHTLQMTTHGFAILSWPVVYRPLHDALIEDSLTTAEVSLGQSPQYQLWPLWVKLLRWVVAGDKARPQTTSNRALNSDAQKQRAG